jgi:hypothetical protein
MLDWFSSPRRREIATARRFRPRLEALEDRTLPASGDLAAVGAVLGQRPFVRLVDPATGRVQIGVDAFDDFRGGVNVATGDVNGDGVLDLIAGAAAGSNPHIRVFDGTDGSLMYSFLAFDRTYVGGVNVAAGDVDYDGRADIIVGSALGHNHVRVYRGTDAKEVSSFLAFGKFNGGISVACADVNGDAHADIIVGAGPGAGAHVKVFDGADRSLLHSFFAFADFAGGVRVAGGDVNADGFADLIVGAGAGAGPHVKTFNGDTGKVLSSFFTFGPFYRGGVQPGVYDVNSDGAMDVVAASASGVLPSAVFTYQGTSLGVVGGTVWTGASTPDGDAVLDWNRAARAAIAADGTPPPLAARALAILHTAIYDAVNNIVGGHDFYHVDPEVTRPDRASAEAAAVAAGHHVLTTLFPGESNRFDEIRASLLSLVPDSAEENAGITYGEEVAAQILELRNRDGARENTSFTEGSGPGDWQPTQPGFASALPNWPDVTPFAMTSASQFRPGEPPALDSAEYADALNEVKELGRRDGSERTSDETEIARFWGEIDVTPAGQWNRIADRVTLLRGGTLVEHARLFALLNIAEADAALVAWDAKYNTREGGLWRPIAAIQNADEDGNDATTGSSSWRPLLATPPSPAYVSEQSTFSGAAESVLTSHFGDMAFVLHADANPGVVRRFESFAAAADEAGHSGVLGGIDYTFSNEAGKASGRALGTFVVETLLIPSAAQS